jgi:hypothetical protein
MSVDLNSPEAIRAFLEEQRADLAYRQSLAPSVLRDTALASLQLSIEGLNARLEKLAEDDAAFRATGGAL